MNDYLKILGCRGSVPVSGERYREYGGATSCYVLRLSGRLLMVDAGSGILSLEELMEPGEKSLDLFISHAHADHVMGLPMCHYSFDKDFTFRVYGKTRSEGDIKAQINAFLEPPTWPVDLDGLAANYECKDVAADFTIPAEGGAKIRVRTLETAHPGGCTAYRFDCNGKSAVIATDCTVSECNLEDFVNFAKDTELLLIDGQYSAHAFSGKPGFGHNSWIKAAEVGKRCGAKQTLIIHHDPFHTDDILDEADKEVAEIHANATLAKEGEVIKL